MPDLKNPTAVRIGQRIKQARKMAGFSSAAQLLTKTDWGAGRLGNYEAGISIPSPDDIETIASITHSSACWIMFGAGPIRASGRDHQAIRHQNLIATFEKYRIQRGGITKFLKATGISRKKIDEYAANPFLEIPDRLAKKLEKLENKPEGWIDEQHVESDPVCAAFPTDMQEIMTIFSNLEKNNRQTLLEIARVINKNQL